VSLLRGPTWPDPGADNGWVRQRLALLPCAPGWCAAGVPEQAQAFREPLWLRPLVGDRPRPEGRRHGLPPLPNGVQFLGLRPLAGGEAVISLANLTPCRQRIDVGPHWAMQARLDGLDQALPPGGRSGLCLELAPWGLGFWRLRPC
jgi:alpha-mannosidase